MSEHPRRIQLDKMTKAELAILEAVREVENLPADTYLTKAVMLLQEARDRVADFVDNVSKPLSPQEKAENAYKQISAMQELNKSICELGVCIHKEHQNREDIK